MPQFTQWNVPDPFPNILFNPMAVDAAIAKTRSELGGLDIERQKFGLEQAKFNRGVTEGEGYISSALSGTDGTPGAGALSGTAEAPGAGAVPGGGGSFLGALARFESGDKNIVSGTDKDNQGLTLAQGGNPAEISQGHFQIHTGTWKDFAPQAGVDINKYPNAMSAPREIQARVASVIPFSRFGPRTQALMRQQFGDIDSNQTVGALAGLGPRAGSAAVAGPGASAPPPATRRVGVSPPPPIPSGNPNAGPRMGLVPPSAVATTPPPSQTGQADDPNTAAVKQAAAALLNMPEPDAAAAYPAVVRELQARGFAMNAPPEYPGHAALQALAGGGTAAAAAAGPSPVAVRTGGTDTAGPGAGQTPLPPVEQPNRLYSAGLPGVTINAPGNPLAPPAPTTAAPAAPPAATRPPLEAPPAAPSRVIQREPLLSNNLTASQQDAARRAIRDGTPLATVQARVEQWKQENVAARHQDAVDAAVQQQQDYDRGEAYRKAQIEAANSANTQRHVAETERVAREQLRLQQEDAALKVKADKRAEEAAKNQGLPTGWRISDDGKAAYRVEGLPPDPKLPDPKPLPDKERDLLLDGGAKLDQIITQRNTFKPDYAGYGSSWAGDLANMLKSAAGESPQADWWKGYQRYRLAIRLGISGQSLTKSEEAAFDRADINPGMAPSTIEHNLQLQQELTERIHNRRIKSLEADGYNRGAIQAASGDRPAQTAAPAKPPPPPAVGAVQDGYRFKGGDPASPDSWEPVK